MKTIEILKQNCIKCNACLEICPSLVFERNNTEIQASNPQSCITCGHCVAICPQNAILHSDFPTTKIHETEKPNIDSLELLKLIKLRRSNRSFTTKQVPQESLDMIIEAAYRAPTASNLQGVKFLLIKDKAILDKIIDATMAHYNSLMKLVDNPIIRPLAVKLSPTVAKYLKTFKQMIEERNSGGDPILRGGTSMLVIYTDKSSRFGCEDSNLAYQNASLMAESLGVAQIYTGFVCNVAHSSKKINKILGIKGKIQAGMALGIPKRKFTKYIDKKEIDLKVL